MITLRSKCQSADSLTHENRSPRKLKCLHKVHMQSHLQCCVEFRAWKPSHPLSPGEYHVFINRMLLSSCFCSLSMVALRSTVLSACTSTPCIVPHMLRPSASCDGTQCFVPYELQPNSPAAPDAIPALVQPVNWEN